MDTREDLAATIGHTPLVRLRRASEATGCAIYGKAEWLNPGGSIKDRTALGMVLDAERRGLLKPGTTIIEGTAGNTGIGLALVGASRGYPSIIVMPETQSAEKINALRLTGAEVRLVPVAKYVDPANYVHVAERLAQELNARDPGTAWFADQFENPANRDFHAATTAQEIWQQTEGQIHGFVCAAGTGGTLAGVAAGLKAHDHHIRVALADPAGSALAHYLLYGSLEASGNSMTEGIGTSRITGNFKDVQVDTAYNIPDTESVPILHALLTEEGLCLGGSSGVNIAGAIRLAHELGPGHCIVTILADSGTRYAGKLFNPAYLRAHAVPTPAWLDRAFPPQ